MNRHPNSKEFSSTIDFKIAELILEDGKINYYDYDQMFKTIYRVLNSLNCFIDGGKIGENPIWRNKGGLDAQNMPLSSSFVLKFDRWPETDSCPLINKSIWFLNHVPQNIVRNQGIIISLKIPGFNTLEKYSVEDSRFVKTFTVLMHSTSGVVQPNEMENGFPNIEETVSFEFCRANSPNTCKVSVKSFCKYQIKEMNQGNLYLLPNQMHNIQIVYLPQENCFEVDINGQKGSIPYTFSNSNDRLLYTGISVNGRPNQIFTMEEVKLMLNCKHLEKVSQVTTDDIRRTQLVRQCLLQNIITRRYIKNLIPLYLHPDMMATVGNASWKGRMLQLTPDLRSQVGACWSRRKVSVGNGFICRFKFRMTKWHADGMAFVIHNAPNRCAAIGPGGCHLGYHNIPNSLAIELDTFRNGDEPASNHVSVHSRGRLPNSSLHSHSLGFQNFSPNINNGELHDALIIYKPESGSLDILIGTTKLTVAIRDLGKYVGLDEERYGYVGFTAATGHEHQTHLVEQFEYYSL